MLSGGPSAFYAYRLAAGEQHAILLCGYQDEESPGRRLLELADKGGGIVDLPNGPVEVRCRIGSYALSAHADSGELAALTKHLDPGHVVLVHGDPEARAGLAALLHPRPTYLPENGDELTIRSLRQASRSLTFASPATPGEAAALGPLDLAAAWERLVSRGQKLLTPHEVAAAWYGPRPSPTEVELASKLLAEDRLYFTSDPRYPGLYRPRTPAQVALDRRRIEAMRQLQHLPGHLVLVRDSNGAVRPAVAFATEGLGFHAWKVGRDGTYHHAEQLLKIISPWEFATTPPESPREKVRLHQLTQQAKPLFRALHPLGLWEKMHAFSGALPLEALAAALSSLPFDPDSPAGRLALAWRLNACPEYFERTELEPGRGA